MAATGSREDKPFQATHLFLTSLRTTPEALAPNRPRRSACFWPWAAPPNPKAVSLPTRPSVACQQLGLQGVSSHGFRRSLATTAVRHGVPLHVIQRITGHKSLGSLGHYLDADESEVLAAITGLSAAACSQP